jgi:hypothetical protein
VARDQGNLTGTRIRADVTGSADDAPTWPQKRMIVTASRLKFRITAL